MSTFESSLKRQRYQQTMTREQLFLCTKGMAVKILCKKYDHHQFRYSAQKLAQVLKVK